MNDLTIAEPVAIDEIRSRIFTIRGVQVILAPDLADMYHVETRIFNQAVKRNLKRFPDNFRFQLTKEELEEVITKCDNPDRLRFSPQLPFAFTEQGIAMLSGVLNSDIAIQVNIRIMNTFVAMRRALATVAPLLARIEATDRRQIADQLRNDANQARNEERFKLILDAMRDKTFPPQKVFFDGQIYDAFEQMKKFVRMAKTELIVIDPYFDDSVLPLIAQKRTGVSVLVVKNLRKNLLHTMDVAKFNAQHGNTLTVKESTMFHDRFLIIDKSILIHVGASLNFLGKRCFAFASLDKSNIPDILAKI
jgi:hypothetical protein